MCLRILLTFGMRHASGFTLTTRDPLFPSSFELKSRSRFVDVCNERRADPIGFDQRRKRRGRWGLARALGRRYLGFLCRHIRSAFCGWPSNGSKAFVLCANF